jgi:hypothetical protein
MIEPVRVRAVWHSAPRGNIEPISAVLITGVSDSWQQIELSATGTFPAAVTRAGTICRAGTVLSAIQIRLAAMPHPTGNNPGVELESGEVIVV